MSGEESLLTWNVWAGSDPEWAESDTDLLPKEMVIRVDTSMKLLEQTQVENRRISFTSIDPGHENEKKNYRRKKIIE